MFSPGICQKLAENVSHPNTKFNIHFNMFMYICVTTCVYIVVFYFCHHSVVHVMFFYLFTCVSVLLAYEVCTQNVKLAEQSFLIHIMP